MTRTTVAYVVVAACCAFTIGRLTARPVPVETVREVKATEDKSARTFQGLAFYEQWRYVEGPSKVTRVYRYLPSGQPSEVTETIERGPVEAKRETSAATATWTDVREHRTHDERTRTVYARDTWALGASAGMGLDGRRVAELHVERRVLGDFHLTMSLNTDRVATVGLEYRF
jgi:hypothetical protein